MIEEVVQDLNGAIERIKEELLNKEQEITILMQEIDELKESYSS